MASSVIRRLSYDGVTRTLFVVFTSGELYAYLEVPPETYAAFAAAASQGRFFARHVRDQFAFRQLSAQD